MMSHIFANEQVRRLRARVNSNFAADGFARETINIMHWHAVVAPLPGFAAVGAGVDGTKERAGEDRTARALKNDRADVLAAQSTAALAPVPAIVTGEHDQPVLRAHPEFARAFSRRINVTAAV